MLRIRYWTTVPIPDGLAAQIIVAYCRVEHPIYGFFDLELFLSDLLSLRLQFCSPLLVNAILYWGSVSGY
jgi:hypothetical protein